jgi:hypothetical protein
MVTRLQDQIHRIRIKNAIRFWYAKKSTLNRKLYNLHLKNGKEWQKLWDTINQNITDKLNLNVNRKYNTINNKLKTLKEHEERVHNAKKTR